MGVTGCSTLTWCAQARRTRRLSRHTAASRPCQTRCLATTQEIGFEMNVLIPQYPTHMGDDGPERRQLDLSDAQRYGELRELIEPTAKPWDQSSMDELDLAV